MNKTFRTLVVPLFGLALAVGASAQNAPPPSGTEQQQPDPVVEVAEVLNLTRAQLERVRTLMEQHEENLRLVLDHIRESANTVGYLNGQPNANLAILARAILAKRAAEGQLQSIDETYKADLNALLTPTQRQIIVDAQAAVHRIGPLSQVGLVDVPTAIQRWIGDDICFITVWDDTGDSHLEDCPLALRWRPGLSGIRR